MTRQALKLTEFQKIAKKRGGQCLSKKYISGKLKLKWQCGKGHTWNATAESIKYQQTWCPKCAGRINDIKLMKKLAKEKGGRCLSEKFISVTKYITWQCNKGHVWEAIPAGIKQGNWCPTCGSAKLTLEDMHKFARKYKGKFLSAKIKGYRDKHKWQCSKGHLFNDSYYNIKRRGYFCKIEMI